jgi:hypothetical protein
MFSILIIFIILLNFIELINSIISFTATGKWDNTPDIKRCEKYLCSNSKKTFVPDDPDFIFYDNVTACDALLKKGINTITVFGDSYQRQVYAGLLITLNGDYQYGSLSEASKTSTCEYHKQFYEKKCGVLQLNHNGRVCGGKIWLDPMLTGIDNLNNCMGKKGTLMLFGFGNHKLGPNRYGVNNATAYSQFFENSICKDIKAKKDVIDGSYEQPCSLWWISTHFRRIGWFPDEKEDVVRDYNLGMRKFFDSKACGNVNYVDMWNMTAALVKHLPEESEQLTYDHVHWGLEVNLVKAQILLNAILRNK